MNYIACKLLTRSSLDDLVIVSQQVLILLLTYSVIHMSLLYIMFPENLFIIHTISFSF